MNTTDLYKENFGNLYYWLLSKTHHGELAEDLAHSAFEQAYRKLPTLRDPAQFKGWLYSIAYHLLVRHYKNLRAWSQESLDDPANPRHLTIQGGNDFVRELEARLTLERVLANLKALKTIHRQAIQRRLAGARCSGTWGSRLNTARKQLAEAIQ